MRWFIFVLLVFISQITLATENFDLSDPNSDFLKRARDYKNLVVYDSSEYYYLKAIDEFSEAKLWTKYMIASIEYGNLMRITGRSDSTWSILNKLKRHPQFKIEDFPNEFSEYLHLKSSLLGAYGEFQKAIAILDSVILIYSLNNNSDTVLAKSYNNLGVYYYYLSRYDIAKEMYELALQTEQKKKYPKVEDLASYYQNIGTIYTIKGDYDSTLYFYEKNLDLNHERLELFDPEIADIYYNMATIYSTLGQYNNAIYYSKLAEKIYSEFGNDNVNLGYVYQLLGTVYVAKSNSENAKIYYRYALNIFNEHLKSGHNDILLLFYRLGLISLSEGNLQEALDYFYDSMGSRKSIRDVIRLQNISIAYRHLGDFEKSKLNLDLASNKLDDEFKGYYKNRTELLRTYSLLYMEWGKIEQAKKSIESSIKIGHEVYPIESNISLSYRIAGDIQFELRNFNSALEYYQKSLIENSSSFSSENPFINPTNSSEIISPSLDLHTLLGKAKSFSELYRLNPTKIEYIKASINCYKDALNIFDNIKLEIDESNKISISNWNRDRFYKVYNEINNLKDLTNDKTLDDLAFKFAEKFKASTLLSNIKSVEALKFGGIPDSLQDKERLLKQRIAGYKRLLYDEKNKLYPDSVKQVIWDRNLFNVNREYNTLISDFKANYQDYYNLIFDREVITLDEVKSKIEADQILLEYVLTDSLLFTFIINKDTTQFVKTKIDSNFYNDLRLLEGLAHTDFSNHRMSDYNHFVSASNSLYKLLIEPYKEIIEGKRLIIVPDGRLGYLPFETLITSLPKYSRMDYRNLAYLIKDHSISYSYSSTLLYHNYQEPKKGSMDVLAFAPEYKPFDDPPAIVERSDNFMPLMNAITEVENISSIFNGDTYLNEEATETKFKEVAEDYDIIHLAMHTMIDDEKPMYSKLVFSNTTDTTNDRYLNTYELYGLRLKAKMAVLSACNTGSGKIEKGEGIMSLARGFIYAGVPSIIMTLWEVEDKSGADIMTLFYQNLKDGMAKDVALQQAKLEYLENANMLRSHPYFWLAYVDIGNTKAFKKQSFIGGLNISLVIVFMLILVTILRYRHKKKSTV